MDNSHRRRDARRDFGLHGGLIDLAATDVLTPAQLTSSRILFGAPVFPSTDNFVSWSFRVRPVLCFLHFSARWFDAAYWDWIPFPQTGISARTFRASGDLLARGRLCVWCSSPTAVWPAFP